ncbi:hypothetical protein [Elizabethkingia occulta]|uniref:hypothetical protein n=1 Tax=Elizabethkingia occulta TaxID=1867263 RepID=UPI0009992E09|nr:hypothetical protein [Elizabethkingia occulta]OPB98007.1 hypothetical protein BB020_14390 [Elizabethkingia occulta]
MKSTRELILDENPFSFEFDIDKLKKLVEDENLADENKDNIGFLFFCHNIFRRCYKGFIEVFETLKLTNEEALRFIYLVVNYHCNEIRKLYFKQLQSARKGNSVINLESVVFEKINFENGLDVSLTQGMERGGDVVIILMKFFISFGKELIGKQSIDEYPDFILTESSEKLWNLASELYAINSFYEILKYEDGKVLIEKGGEIIKIKKSELNIKLTTLEVIGEVRSLNNYNEYSFGFKSLLKGKMKQRSFDAIKIQKGVIFPNLGYKNTNELFTRDTVLSLRIGNIFSKDDYEGVDLIDLMKIFSSISQLVKIAAQEVLNKNYNIKDIPFAIDKNLLIEKISIITNIDNHKITAIINSITDKSDTPYFWRKPLFERNNRIYLSFSLLLAPNYSLLLESYCETLTLDLVEKQQRFKKYILSELTDIKYCKIVIDEEISNIIILELRDYYLSIHIFYVTQFPIEAKESRDYLDRISIETFEISENLKSLHGCADKPYVPIILTNYNKYSGLLLNDIPVLDIVLLKNYLVTGAFQKGQVIRNKRGIKSDILSDFTYYDDEDDFNSNLITFLHCPVPVYEIKNKIFWTEKSMLPSDSDIQIYIDHYNYEKEDGNIEYELNILSNTLKTQYLTNPKGKLNELANKNIIFRLTNIFHYITFSKYQLTSYRHQLIKIFSEINIDGYIHLLYYFSLSLRYLNNVKLKKDVKFKPVEYDSKEVFKSLEKVFEKNNKICITTINIGNIYTKDEEKKIISLAIDVIASVTIKKYELEEIESYLLMLAIIGSYKNKYNLSDYFYLGASNIISTLNHNFLYQQARNLSEEIFAIAIKEGREYKGWGILFMCSDQQCNKFNSLIYSCFYLNSLSVVDRLPYTEAIDVFYNILKFARNLEFPEILDDVFEFIVDLRLEEYDFQKVHLTYYLSISNRKQEDRKKIVDDSIVFFYENKKKIFKYGNKGVIPWLNYFYNIKRLNNEGFKTVSVDDIITSIEKVLDEKDFLPIKNRHFYNADTKENFIKNLKKIFSTYNVNDFVSEITNLEMDANIIIENAIEKQDFESILLTGLVFNDIRLIYKESYVSGGEVEFINNNPSNKMLDQYLKNILCKLTLKPKQLFIYFFSHRNTVHYLMINSEKKILIKDVTAWNCKYNFLKSKNKFYFNSVDYYGIEEQEEHYSKLLEELKYTTIDIEEEFEELLITTNLKVSKTPFNLIVNNGDFIGAKKPITNVLLIEWFIENYEDLVIESLLINCWIPIEDGDPTLNLGYEKIKPVLYEFNIETFTTSIPELQVDKDINIFFAHGELDKIGFKAVSLNDEKFIANKEKIFGHGKIAILFICHSGSINEDLFSNKVQSLIYELVQYGYSSVIAPFWALEATIPSFWLRFFLTNFKDGYTISESVYLANNTLADYQKEISDSFFVPEGRLAMHLYGNPNIVVKRKM